MSLLRYSALAKVLGLVFIAFALCLPLAMIGSLIDERGASRQAAAAELADTHAGPQTLAGPFLVVPYVERWSEPQLDGQGRVVGRTAQSRQASHVVFPEKLHLEGSLAPQERYRGIFTVLFYRLDGRLSGRFAPFDAAALPRTVPGSQVEVQPPLIGVALSDPRGLVGTPSLSAAGTALRLAQQVPGAPAGSRLERGVHAPLAGAAREAFERGQPLDFTLALGLVGHEKLAVAPVAQDTTAHLRSPWPHPSFGGRFLATERTLGDDGFDARWAVSSLTSAAPSQALQEAGKPLDSFDVSLVEPLNVYAMTNRAVKYGALFVTLVLMASFMFELLRRLRIHPVQYGLVGLSLVLFFLLLLALSEKLAFAWAYAAAAGASVALLGIYFSAVLQGWRRGVGLAGFVAVLYGALYGLLASENNALLLGSLLLFGMLAALMIATRKVDWGTLSRPVAA